MKYRIVYWYILNNLDSVPYSCVLCIWRCVTFETDLNSSSKINKWGKQFQFSTSTLFYILNKILNRWLIRFSKTEDFLPRYMKSLYGCLYLVFSYIHIFGICDSLVWSYNQVTGLASGEIHVYFIYKWVYLWWIMCSVMTK